MFGANLSRASVYTRTAMTIDIATLRPKLEAALGEQLRLGDLLGQGGFAAVFRAHDPFLERDVAIKVLDPARRRRRAGGSVSTRGSHDRRS